MMPKLVIVDHFSLMTANKITEEGRKNMDKMHEFLHDFAKENNIKPLLNFNTMNNTEAMKEFKSTNNLLMVEGKLFNWRKESLYHGKDEPFGYIMDMGSIGRMYSAVYQPIEMQLCIYDTSLDFVARFFCEDVYVAETIVAAFIKGNDLNMKDTIYFKKK